MSTLRLTAAQAMVRWLAVQYVEVEGVEVPYFADVSPATLSAWLRSRRDEASTGARMRGALV